MTEVQRLLPDRSIETLAEYLDAGGGRGIVGARGIGPNETIAEIDAAGLRGRGGAGFPTATKWRSVAEGGGGSRYAVCNGAEGEPGTFKDRVLLLEYPELVFEGMITASFSTVKFGFTLNLKSIG